MEQRVVVGVGARRGADGAEVLRLIDSALAAAALPRGAVVLLATLDAKTGEPGLRSAALALGVPLVGHPAALLAGVPVPHPSGAARTAVGTPSVAEAAALASAPGGVLLVPKLTSPTVAVALAAARPRATPAERTGDPT